MFLTAFTMSFLKRTLFVLPGYRKKRITGLSEVAANSLLSLMLGPPCVANS